MDQGLTRRQVTGGMAGLAAVCLTTAGIPAIAAAVPHVPRPPGSPLLEEQAPYVMEEIRALYRVACDERAALHEFAAYGECGKAWSHAYIVKVDAATCLRDWLHRNAPGQHALQSWLDAIHPQTSFQTQLLREAVGSVSGGLRGQALLFERQIQHLTRHAPANDAASRDAYETAWSILGTDPRNMEDAALHRLAADFIYHKNGVPA